MENQKLLLQIARLQDQLEIARLQDQLEFASEQADTFAKSLKNINDWLEHLIEEIENENDKKYKLMDLKQLKNSIPKNALKRAE